MQWKKFGYVEISLFYPAKNRFPIIESYVLHSAQNAEMFMQFRAARRINGQRQMLISFQKLPFAKNSRSKQGCCYLMMQEITYCNRVGMHLCTFCHYFKIYCLLNYMGRSFPKQRFSRAYQVIMGSNLFSRFQIQRIIQRLQGL